MTQLLSVETQYYFDLTDKQWWVLPKLDNEWKELPNDEAYKLGLFKAVSSQQCNFLGTDLSQYELAVCELLKELDVKFAESEVKPPDVDTNEEQKVGKVLTRDFADNEAAALNTKSEQNVRFEGENAKGGSDEGGEITPQLSKQSSKGEPAPKAKDAGSENLLSQINNLIASTSQMKQICKAKEQSAQSKGNAPNLRSTARHLTYVNNGGLAGCLKTVAEERKKMGTTKKPGSQGQNAQLQEMIERAKAMAAKTVDEAKEAESATAVKKEPQDKKAPLRSNKKKYTTVFAAAALKDLRMNQPLPDVKFEVSSEDESDEEGRGKAVQGGSKEKNGTQMITRRGTAGRQ